jgi:hypothetical protein
MSYIIAIDVGIKNLGFAVLQNDSNLLVYWERVSLVPHGNYQPYKSVEYVHKFVQDHATYFANAKLIIIERQMRVNMRIIEAIVHTMFIDRCLVVQAQHVKLHFGLNTRDYRKNKKAAVDFVNAQMQSEQPHITNLQEWSGHWLQEGKQDDLADAAIMIMYYVRTYSLTLR